MSEWIDKKISLPKRGKRFEALDKDKDIICGVGTKGKLQPHHLKDEYLTHWRYVPSPPKSE